MSGMMASVCTSLTSGMASIASQLPDMSQLEQTRADLKSRGQDLTSDPDGATSTPDNMEESLMSPYLPDSGDLANHQIMESAYVASDSPFSTSETAQKDSLQVRSKPRLLSPRLLKPRILGYTLLMQRKMNGNFFY